MSELDDALGRFSKAGLEYAGGLANHGPMAAEALVQLGHAALIPGFADVYAPRLPDFLPGRPIPLAERASALGRPERFADWVASFEADLESAAWPQVLADALRSLPLLPGLFAGATHGWLRVAHAVRALEAGESAPRRRELAFGLAYWAGRHQSLPGTPGTRRIDPQAKPDWESRFDAVALVPPELRRAGFFFDSVRVLDDDSEFEQAVEAIAHEPRPLDDALTQLCRAGARLYLANPQARIAYVHAVTAPSALRLVAPYLDEETTSRAFAFAAQAAMALHAISGKPDDLPSAPSKVDPEVERMAESPEEIRYRAACSLEEHAIKLAEACLREDRLQRDADPVFRLAAADAALSLESGQARAC